MTYFPSLLKTEKTAKYLKWMWVTFRDFTDTQLINDYYYCYFFSSLRDCFFLIWHQVDVKKNNLNMITEFSMHTYIDTHIVISVNLEWAACTLLGCLVFPVIDNYTALCSAGVCVFDAMGSVWLLKTMFIFPFISVNAFLQASFFSALKLCCFHCELMHANWGYAVSQ